eukprot:856627-Rhodomonas_salina.3
MYERVVRSDRFVRARCSVLTRGTAVLYQSESEPLMKKLITDVNPMTLDGVEKMLGEYNEVLPPALSPTRSILRW